MAVPKAAVDENHSLVLRQNNVRLAGEILDLQTETKTTGEEIFPDYQFQLCILPLDSRHSAATLFRSHRVGHQSAIAR